MRRVNKMRVFNTPHFVTQSILLPFENCNNVLVINNYVTGQVTCHNLFKTKEITSRVNKMKI